MYAYCPYGYEWKWDGRGVTDFRRIFLAENGECVKTYLVQYEMGCGLTEASEMFMDVEKETERVCVCMCVRAGAEEGRLGS